MIRYLSRTFPAVQWDGTDGVQDLVTAISRHTGIRPDLLDYARDAYVETLHFYELDEDTGKPTPGSPPLVSVQALSWVVLLPGAALETTSGTGYQVMS